MQNSQGQGTGDEGRGNSQLVVEGVEVVEVVEGVEEWLNLLFFIFHSSFVLAVPLSPVPRPWLF
jgi:hypothetical protein